MGDVGVSRQRFSRCGRLIGCVLLAAAYTPTTTRQSLTLPQDLQTSAINIGYNYIVHL